MRRARSLYRGGASKTVFSPADYRRLEGMLRDRPQTVLDAFGLAQVDCLVEVDAYHRIKADRADLAVRIVAIAAMMGIPETLPSEAHSPGEASDES